MKHRFAGLIAAFIAVAPASADNLEERLNVLLQGEDFRAEGFRAMSLDEALKEIALLIEEHEALLAERDELAGGIEDCKFEARHPRDEPPRWYD